MAAADPIPDLNATIASAVQARVEAQVAEAMLRDDTFTTFVSAALQQPITVKDGYKDRKTTFLRHTLEGAIESRTKALVSEVIAEQDEQIKNEVRKALRKSIGVISDSLVDGFVANAASRYPSIKVEFGSE